MLSLETQLELRTICPKCGQEGQLYSVDAQDFLVGAPWSVSKEPAVREICSNCIRG